MAGKTSEILYNEVPPLGDTPGIEGRPYCRGDWKNVPQIVQDGEKIHGFFGEFRWLSNFGRAKVMLDGIEYDSTEKAYQAAKWSPEDRWPFVHCKNEDTIRYNRSHEPNRYTPEQWDEIRVEVMRFLLLQKFDPDQNPEMAQRLIATGDRHIEETNWWGDTFWGVDLEGVGDNNLGKLLMEIRAQLHEDGNAPVAQLDRAEDF